MKHLLRFFATIIAATYLSGIAAISHGFAASLTVLLAVIIVAVWSLHWD